MPPLIPQLLNSLESPEVRGIGLSLINYLSSGDIRINKHARALHDIIIICMERLKNLLLNRS